MNNKINGISFEEFAEHISAIKDIHKFRDTINETTADYTQSHKFESGAEFCFPTLEYNLVKLLTAAANDSNKWIDYYIYELDFGERENGENITVDENPVTLKTIKDLWDLMRGEPHYTEVVDKNEQKS